MVGSQPTNGGDVRYSRNIPFWSGLLLLVHALTPVMVSAKAPDLEAVPEILQLQSILRTTADRDSVRFLLARAYRETGTMEGRERALDLLRQVRPRYYEDYRYHQELAVTYLEGERFDDAKESMRRAVQRGADPVQMRGLVAELLFRAALRTGSSELLQELLRTSNGTLRQIPDDRTSLLYKAITLSLARCLFPALGVRSSLGARACTDAILREDPADRLALLLEATYCLEAGEPERADQFFRWGLKESPPDYRAAFDLPLLCASDTVQRQLAEAPTAIRDSLSTAYWESRDPTPLTPVNENLLEYWKRLVLADVFFGQGDTLRGWHTPRGEIFVRYGPPQAMQFQMAYWEGGDAMVQADAGLARQSSHSGSATAPLLYPQQTWQYNLGGAQVDFAFVDPTLHDRFLPASRVLVESVTRATPSILAEESHGDIRNCLLGSAGTRGEGERTLQSLIVGLPVADSGTDPWADARVDVRMLDRVGRELSHEVHAVPAGSVLSLPLGASMTCLTREMSLPPGRYTADIQVEAGRHVGMYTIPMEIRSFGRDSLQLSDLRLAFAPQRAEPAAPMESTPDPTGLVTPGTRLDVAFELYNLKPEGDIARYQVRYTVLPAAYAREYSRLLAAGNAARDPALQFGALGRSLGGVTLDEGTYADVLFPRLETRLAKAARCRSAFRLETAGLREGTYALLVTVTDLNAGRTASVRTPFTVISEEAFRAAFGAE